LPEIEFVEADLGNPGLLANPALKALAAGPVDGLINCAAIQLTPWMTSTDFDPQSIRREIAVNLAAPCELCALFLPALIRAGPEAFILNVNSGLALVPKPASAVYCASKAALDAFSRSLRMQLEGTPVSVFQVFLPLVDTPMTTERGGGKMDALSAAIDILDGIEREIETHDIGKVTLLRLLARLSPRLAQKVMRRAP
jgi:short-subunit dehydrogenase involved in D-alanine esterification of teichoic acids